jgi:hypothetical protein
MRPGKQLNYQAPDRGGEEASLNGRCVWMFTDRNAPRLGVLKWEGAEASIK